MKYGLRVLVLSSLCMSIGYVRGHNILKHADAMPKLSSTEKATYALQKSIKVRNKEAAYVALILGADINAQDPVTGNTPLIEALSRNDGAMVDMLRRYGADNNVH